MLKRKNKKALPEQLEDSLYPDDYWLDMEDGQEVSEPLPCLLYTSDAADD